MAAIGKPINEADAELCEGLDFIHYYCEQALSIINNSTITIREGANPSSMEFPTFYYIRTSLRFFVNGK